jgi:hypothetical protein
LRVAKATSVGHSLVVPLCVSLSASRLALRWKPVYSRELDRTGGWTSGKRGCMRVFDTSNLAGPRCQPVVTVAVPSFNQGGFLDATLRSIFSHRFPWR